MKSLYYWTCGKQKCFSEVHMGNSEGGIDNSHVNQSSGFEMISSCTREREDYMTRIGIYAVVLMMLCVFVGRAGATTIDPRLWEQLVWGADFVGVAECTTAGGMVAEYRVLESWKGGRDGDTIRIRISSNYWEPQFPIALVGERYLFTAYKSHAPSRILSFTMGGPVPLWWRQIESDYHLPLFQGSLPLLPKDGWQGRFRCRGGEELDLDEFREYVKEILPMQPAERELLLLRLLTEKYIRYRGKPEELTGPLKEAYERLRTEISQCDDAGVILEKLWAFTVSDYEKARYAFRTVVTQAIQTEASWEKLCRMLTESSQMDERERRWILVGILQRRAKQVEELSLVTKRYGDQLRKKLDAANKVGDAKSAQAFAETLREIERIQKPVEAPPHVEPEAPTIEQLAAFRKRFHSDQKDYKWGRAFEALSEYEPQTVSKWLVKWENQSMKWGDAHRGYELGSLFAWKCGRDRKKHLARLLIARDDYVRVTGAVYLTFEDKQMGLKYLREFMSLKAEPGRWAAVNLARRGDMRAMDAAVMACGDLKSGTGMVEVPGRNLSKRVLILLSNSAKHSGIDQAKLLERDPKSIKAWWKENRSALTIHDPWLEVLTRQKVD